VTGGLPSPPPVAFVRHSLSGETMGTTWNLTAYLPPELLLSQLQTAVQNELDLVVSQMSHWRDDSDLSRFNRAPANTWHELPEEFFTVLQSALSIAAITNGAFDPALGAVVNTWGFGPTNKESKNSAPPGAWRRIQLDPVTRRALQPGDVILDFSAIAKGFAVDRVAGRLPSSGLIEIGGELRGHGIKPDINPWWVSIEPPAESMTDEIIVALCNEAIATSGDYRRFREHDGVRYAHTIDPRTAEPSKNRVASVSVLHEEAMVADAYSTALMVLGPDEGLRLADKLSLSALFLLRDEDRFSIRYSRAFERMLTSGAE